MKSVLISIQPKWCELIASGKKTVEVRKTKPKLETPFKVYIYCTKNKEKLIEVIHEGDEVYGFIHKGKPNFIKTFTNDWSVYGAFKGGKVIGEFVCDEITEYEGEFYDDETYENIRKVIHTTDWDGYPEIDYNFIAENGEENSLCKSSCLAWEELRNYMGAGINIFYGWHISDLVIYDKPRELSEFKTPEWFRHCEKQCDDMERMRCPTKDSRKVDKMCDWCRRGGKPITRPPQSWCYVESEDTERSKE